MELTDQIKKVQRMANSAYDRVQQADTSNIDGQILVALAELAQAVHLCANAIARADLEHTAKHR